MNDSHSKSARFLKSALSMTGLHTLSEFRAWFARRSAANRYAVKRIPLEQLKDWHFQAASGDLEHASGRFFRIEGLAVQTNFREPSRWMQPIINQPEIGILGYLVKEFAGVLHFLAQAKMEPGNINLVQISPTVQATRSNYTRVHGGQSQKFIEFFLERGRGKVLVDQLQSEQGARYIRKRNRNMIIEVDADDELHIPDDFYWLTLGQLQALHGVDNLINMDSRTVLSCIRFAEDDLTQRSTTPWLHPAGFAEEVFVSALAGLEHAEHDFDSLISWITEMKSRYELSIQKVPLQEVEHWQLRDGVIRHDEHKFFSIVGVSVIADNREVSAWDQPLIESAKGGIIAFLCQKRRGVLHFLTQARIEPGNLDNVELAPTVQYTPSNYEGLPPEAWPPFYEWVASAKPSSIRHDSCQSEEGGRFYHDRNRYRVVELPADQELDLPLNFKWLTLRQLKDFIRFNNYLNIEARGLISCLGLSKPSGQA